MKKLVFILVSILLVSCASRKVQVNNTEIKTDSIVERKDTVAIKTVDSIFIKKDVSIDEIIITPLDTCRSFIVDGKLYKNVIITIKKVKDNSLYSKKKTLTLNTSKTQKNHTVKATTIKTKQVDKKSNLFWYFILYIFFAIVLFVVYRYLSKISILRLFG
jgi:hypothetical protein